MAQGPLARLARLSSLAGKVGSGYVGRKVAAVFQNEDTAAAALDRLHIRNAETIVRTMGEMKGAAMKLGQGLALAAGTLDLSPELRSILGKVHDKVVPVPWEEIRRQVESSLDQPIDRAFARFDREPLGTASLGQAHRAVLPDGRPVVVKVLHRGIEQSVGADLLALRGLLLTARAIGRPKEELDDAWEEIRDRLTEETDYRREAANLVGFRTLYALDTRIQIPAVHLEWTSQHVLTMDELPGVTLERFLETATPAARQRAGLTLAEFFYKSSYEHLCFQADPHPGNYLFEPDGRVGVLDFGCVKRLDARFMADYAGAALASMAGDREAALDHARRVGVWIGDDEKVAQTLWKFCSTLATPFRQDSFVPGSAEDRMYELMTWETKLAMATPQIRAPREILFLHRTLGGTYALLRRLQPRLRLGALLGHYGGLAVARMEDRPWPQHVPGWDVGAPTLA